MENKIKAIGVFYSSKIDSSGNSYNFVVFTKTSDGKTAHGYISGNKSSMDSAMLDLYGEYGNFKTFEIELPIRRFNQLVKFHNVYLGCRADEIVPNILKQWDDQE